MFCYICNRAMSQLWICNQCGKYYWPVSEKMRELGFNTAKLQRRRLPNKPRQQ